MRVKHRCSQSQFEAPGRDVELLAACGSRRSVVVSLSLPRVCTASIMAPILLYGFLLVKENRYQCRSFVKAKPRSANFWKAGDTCVSPWLNSLPEPLSPPFFSSSPGFHTGFPLCFHQGLGWSIPVPLNQCISMRAVRPPRACWNFVGGVILLLWWGGAGMLDNIL